MTTQQQPIQEEETGYSQVVIGRTGNGKTFDAMLLKLKQLQDADEEEYQKLLKRWNMTEVQS